MNDKRGNTARLIFVITCYVIVVVMLTLAAGAPVWEVIAGAIRAAGG